jgi:hypothetical protein
MNADAPSLIECDLEGFKRLAAEFLKALPNAKTVEQVDAGIRCLGIAYFDMTNPSPADVAIAVSVLDYVTRKAGERILQLTLGSA